MRGSRWQACGTVSQALWLIQQIALRLLLKATATRPLALKFSKRLLNERHL